MTAAAAATRGPDRFPVHTAAADAGLEYGTWAAGRRYKASFHDGAVFVPYLGVDQPENVTFRWQTRSVAVGGVELVAHAAGAANLSHGDYRVEYDLGGVVEAYDVLGDGLEQTFVVDELPAAGDLVVRGAVETSLWAAAAAPAHRALGFVDAAGREVLSYGAATAIDAAGRAQPMTTAFADGEVTLRLDAAWLETAAFPVVVDPMLGVTFSVSGVGDVVGGDVCRDDEAVSSNVWEVHARAASASDFDIFAWRSNDDGTNPTGWFSDMTANWSSYQPSVAFNAGSDRALVAYTRILSGNNHQVRVHWHDRNDPGASTSVIGVGAPLVGVFHWRPDVGGTTLNAAGTNILIVMQRESTAGTFGNSATSEIVACDVDMAGAVSISAPFVVLDAPLTDAEWPSVNKRCMASSRPTWLLAYQRRSTLGFGDSTWNVAMHTIATNGTVSAATTLDQASTSARHEMTPVVEGADGRYLVACAASTTAQAPSAPSGRLGHQLQVSRVDWPVGAAAGSQPWPTQTLNSNATARIDLGGVSYDNDTDSHWGVLFRSDATENVYLRVVGYRGEVVAAATVLDPGPGVVSSVGGVCYDDDNDRHICLFGDGAWANQDRFEYHQPASWTTDGIACSAATIEWLGSQQIGSEFGAVRISGAPAGCVQFLAVALAPASQALIGIPGVHDGCWLLIPNTGPDFLGTVDVRFGSTATWNLPLPEFLIDDTIYFQGFHTDAGLTEIYSTQRLNLGIAR